VLSLWQILRFMAPLMFKRIWLSHIGLFY